ncbi:MAG: hypothetical protein IPK15_11940 [Verrucomicrobia bacterium]|nr:hypothetical protein [Verrucomicrobiota bacterium]
MMNRARGPLWLYVLFALSGAAGLGYQMVWVRMFAAGLGHETPAMLGVASAFLGGLAVGGWYFDQRIGSSSNAVRWYVGIEIVIGGFGLLTALTIPLVNQLAVQLIGPEPSAFRQWSVVFLLPFVTLLPATAAMGATLPAMERLLSPLMAKSRCIGAIYAANTFGAVAGTLGTVFVVMPALGFRATLGVLAAVNVICAVAAWRFWGAEKRGPENRQREERTRNRSASVAATATAGVFRRHVWQRHCSSQDFSASGLRSWWCGSCRRCWRTRSTAMRRRWRCIWSGRRSGERGISEGIVRRVMRWSLSRLLTALAAACLLSAALLHFGRPIYSAIRGGVGESLTAAALGESLMAAVAFLIPTVLMGATFSHLVQSARREDGGVGRAGAVNTLGCAAAGLVGAVLLPLLGTKTTALALGVGYLLVVPNWRKVGWLLAAVPVALGLAAMADLRIVDKLPGAEVIAYQDGAMASVAVVKTADGHRSLRVNNRLQMGGTAAAMAERRQAHLPLLLHPAPRRALFLGPGTGVTLGAATAHPELTVDGVELVAEVISLMHHFEPENEGPLPKKGGRVLSADARRFVRVTTNRYDVIVADLFHPAHDGAGFLYTKEHFQAVRERLAPGGLFCQWLPLHQLEEPVMRSIVRTFLDTFSETRGFLLHFNVDIPALALVGTLDKPVFEQGLFEKRLADGELRSRLRGVGLERFINLAGCFVADAGTLDRFAGSAPLSTDNSPVVLFAAPRFAVKRDVRVEALLLSVLEKCQLNESALAKSGFDLSDERFASDLKGFMAARDIYLKGLVKEGAGDLSGAVEMFLASAGRSLLFTPSYARCVTIIQVMAQTDRDRAKELFQELEAAQPAQPLGKKLLGPLLDPAAAK